MDQFETNWLSVEFSAAAAEIETWSEGLKASFESIVSQSKVEDSDGSDDAGFLDNAS